MSSDNIYTPSLKEIETNALGITELLNFYGYANNLRYCKVVLNLSPLNSVDANLSALILAIAHKLKHENKVYVFVELADHMNVFFRNGLISHLKGDGNNNAYGDTRLSTIPLTSFSVDEDEKFCQYLRTDFFSHRGLENLTQSTKTDLSTQFRGSLCQCWVTCKYNLSGFYLWPILSG